MDDMTGIGPGSLSALLDFDHVIALSADGVASDAPGGIYAPECVDPAPDDCEVGQGWTLITSGLTGQYGYSGPWLHNSELLEGGVARAILAHASDNGGGYYVAVVAYYYCEECAGGGTVWADDEMTEEVRCPEECEPGANDPEGWAVAYRPF